MNIWQELEITATRDAGEIRRAYARRLRRIDQRREREAFQRLRVAYEAALAGVCRDPTGVAEGAAGRPIAHSPVPAAIAQPAAPAETPTRELGETQGRRNAAPGNPARAALPEPEAKPDDPRERDWNRARELVRTLVASMIPGAEPSARERFRQIMKSEELHSLSLREMLEWQLLHALNQNPKAPLEFVVTVAEFFDWRNRPDLLANGAGPALQALLRRTEAKIVFFELQDLAVSTATLPKDARARQKAARAILAPFSRWRCMCEALSRTTLMAVSGLLQEIDERAPEVLRSYLDPRTCSWWQKRMETAPWTYGHFGVALYFSLVIWIVSLASVTPGSISGISLLGICVTATVATFFLGSKLVFRMRRVWGPRIAIQLNRLKERSLGRAFPGAVKLGLGWRHLAAGTGYSPFIALPELERWSAVERLTGAPILVAILLIAATLLVFTVYIVHFQLWSWIDQWKPRWNGRLISVIATALLVFLAVFVMQAYNHYGPLTAAFVAAVIRLYRHARPG